MLNWRPWPRDIGRPRVYEPHEQPVLYPGESMEALVNLQAVDRLISQAIFEGRRNVEFQPRWHVTPTRGWKGLWLRMWFRLTWWLPWKRKAKIEAELKVKEKRR